MGASFVIGVDGDENRLAMSKRMGADLVLDYREVDVVEEVLGLTGGVDIAIEALGTQRTFESALRCLRPHRRGVSALRRAKDGVLEVAIRP